MAQWIRYVDNGVTGFGTSSGVGSTKPGSTVAISIDGIGALVNRFE